MGLLPGRSVKRVDLAVRVLLQDPQSEAVEEAFTENVSPVGASILARRAMRAGGNWVMALTERNIRTPVRVIYCRLLTDNVFRVGLEIQGSPLDWFSEPPRGSN